MPLILGTNSIKDTGYDVANSLRFDGASSSYLNRTFGSSGNRKTFTISFWIKKCVSKDHGQADGLMILGGQQDSYPGFVCMFQRSTDTLIFRDAQASNNVKFDVRTDAKFRDFSAWSNIVIAMDTTQGTASNRIKVYINGTQTTDLNGVGTTGGGTEDPLYPDQNFDSQFNSNVAHFINKYATNYEDFYLCEYCFIDGQQLDATSFGEFDADTGIWKPIDVSGLTFGTNGFYLDFENSGSLGADVSGNGNNFTVNNLTAIDQSTDTCTNNFATLNPLFPAGGTLTFSQGNTSLTAPNDGLWKTTLSTMASQNGKWYMEFKSGGNYIMAGVCDFNVTSRGINGDNFATKTTVSTHGYGYYNGDGSIRYEGGTEISGYGATYGSGDIIGIALDCDNNKLYFSKNGVWQNSGDPTSGATGTGAVSLDTTAGRFWGFAFSIYQTNDRFANFGNPAFTISSGNSDGNGYGNFEYSVPSGYYSLNTKNLAEYG